MVRKIFCIALLGLLISDAPRAQRDGGEWQLVFSDEFNGRSGSRPDSTVWSSSRRGDSTWNRWIGDSPEVAFIRNGKLICRAIRNTKNPADTAAMITGAVETQHRFSFQYGKIEVRAKTKRHRGNFPAIWLIPEPPAPNHPDGGEIDIFETIDMEHTAYHTVHSRWTLTLNKGNSPKHNFSERISVGRWHVYGLEWDAEKLVWTVDGKTVGVYMKSKSSEALANGQWPFDHPFYIILNQSVGREGAWAQPADLDFVYETQFDWVRVYQKK